MKKIINLALMLTGLFLTSCTNFGKLPRRMDYIKEVGDTNPQLAMRMADSLEQSMRGMPEGVTMKYDLLRIRIQDKAYVPATSDIPIRQVVNYYERKGNGQEQQEAYYYAGSVYRDLHDTPHAMEYFLKSSAKAEKVGCCDSVMLRNTYSNLCYLYFGVQDYQNTYHYAFKEYVLSRKLGKVSLSCYSYLGLSLEALDSIDAAHKYFLMALDTINKTPTLQGDIEIVSNLLFNFSFLGDVANAVKCHNLLTIDLANTPDNDALLALGKYYDMVGERDSAVYFYGRILDDNSDLMKMYDASKALFLLYHHKGDYQTADKYASLYIQISDSIDLGKRQELAATVNNAFQYHRNLNEEQRIKEENVRVHSLLALAVAIAVGLLLAGVIVFLYRRNKNLKTKLSMSKELVHLNEEKKKMAENIATQKEELERSKEQLKKSEVALGIARRQKETLSEQLEEASREIKEKERLLGERIEQNKSLFNLLHKSELEEQAEEIIRAVREAAEGKRLLSTADWQQIFKAVDDIYPTFKNRLLEKAGKITDDKLRFCYLLRIGLLNPQIENLMPMSRATVWRWSRKYSWVVEL